MLPCHSCYIYLLYLEEQIDRGFKAIVWREAEGGSTKAKGGNFYGGGDPSAILSELPTYFNLFWSRKSTMICTK